MSARLPATVILCCALFACDRPDPARTPEPRPTAASGYGNGAAAQSIMQEEVIAETQPLETPEPTPTPTPLPTATIGFAVGAALDDAGRSELDRLLASDALPGGARFVLRGSSDSMGSDRDNLVTSRRRAAAVRAYLIDKEVPADRIEIIALGERRPVAPNATLDGADDPAARARNRRVDVEVLAPATSEPSGGEEQDAEPTEATKQ